MKNRLLYLLFFVVTLLISPISFADEGYYHQPVTKTDLKNYYKNPTNTLIRPTDIWIYNSTFENIYVYVPGTPVYDILYPGASERLINDYNYGDTRVIIQNFYRLTFFDSYVCRHAILSVNGAIYNYNVFVDRRYCN